MSSTSDIIKQIIAENSQNDKVDIIGIANKLQIKIFQKEFTNDSDLGRADFPVTAERPRIILNKHNDKKQNYTLVALLMASCIMSPDAVQEIGVTYDVFSLRDTIKKRYNSVMFLATRLAIPDSIIAKLDDPSFDIDSYARNSEYLPEFITAVVKESSANVIMDS